MIIENSDGHKFLDFIKIDESKIIDSKYSPLTHSLLVIKYQNRFLVVFDKWKKHWELPGGSIENNESPRECAIRELFEETNQNLPELNFKGLMKFQLKPDDRIEFGALYSGTLLTYEDFKENDEIKEILFWDRSQKIDIDEIDEKLLDYF